MAFLIKGCVRHFYLDDGDEITCDVSLENSVIVDLQSFDSGLKSKLNFQALEDSELLLIRKKMLNKLYSMDQRFERFSRRIAEKMAIRCLNIAMSLTHDKPEKRYSNLVKEKPELLQRIPQKYIANILGIKPESLSRIHRRVSLKEKALV